MNLPTHRSATATAIAAGVVVLAAFTAGCSAKGGGGDGIPVAAGDDSCEVATTDVPSGTVTFTASNEGGDVTEVYVYTPAGDIMGEVENIGPGTSRDLTVELDPGLYEVVCKPGMVGDGIATSITVTDALLSEPATTTGGS